MSQMKKHGSFFFFPYIKQIKLKGNLPTIWIPYFHAIMQSIILVDSSRSNNSHFINSVFWTQFTKVRTRVVRSWSNNKNRTTASNAWFLVFRVTNVSFWLKFSMNVLLQTCGIKIGYGRPQGQSGGRDGTVAAGGACCSWLGGKQLWI
jgi:hypothetical protein